MVQLSPTRSNRAKIAEVNIDFQFSPRMTEERKNFGSENMVIMRNLKPWFLFWVHFF